MDVPPVCVDLCLHFTVEKQQYNTASDQKVQPPEFKHISKGRKRKKHRFPYVAASEKGKAQPDP